MRLLHQFYIQYLMVVPSHQECMKYTPSRTLIISSTDIINEMTDEIKAKGQAKLRFPNKTIIGAVQKGTRT